MKERPVNNLGEMLRAKLANETFKSDLKLAKERYELEQMKMQAAMQNNIYGALNQAALQNAAISGNGAYGNQLTQASMQHAISRVWQDEMSFDPNTKPVYQMALSALADLWRAKHGDQWIQIPERTEEFWVDAQDRLGSAGLLESTRGWMRLKD